jgi:hypothetical protein
VQKRGAGQTSSALRKAADEFEDLYETLLAYEKTPDFPDALIERTDIVRYHLKLTLGKGSNDAHVNRTMTNVWGRDWRVRLNRAIGVLR